jgi:hypothetical protein
VSPRSDENSYIWWENQKEYDSRVYERNITKKGGYIITLDDIGLWIDSKNSENLDSNAK